MTIKCAKFSQEKKILHKIGEVKKKGGGNENPLQSESIKGSESIKE